MDWLKDIKIEDMPTPDLEMVAHVCGLESAVMLLMSFAGVKLKIPKLWYRAVVRRKIVDEFDGRNVNRLAKRYGVSRRFVYKVLEEERHGRRNGGSRTRKAG